MREYSEHFQQESIEKYLEQRGLTREKYKRRVKHYCSLLSEWVGSEETQV